MNTSAELSSKIFELCKKYPEATHELKGRGFTVEDLVDVAINNLPELFNDLSLRDSYTDAVVSDLNAKRVKRLANKRNKLSRRDVAFLMEQANNKSLDDMDLSEQMLEGYAENLKNYLYTYKESAKNVDASIDPDELHVGPMAQDIEKVAPDCIKETPEGIKMVDGSRLALVNAGMIGDLARRLLKLENIVGGQPHGQQALHK